VMEISRLAYETGLRQPPELSLLGKALLNLDQIAARLDPGFDPTAAVREHADGVMQQRMRPSRERLYATALDAREFVEELPGRLNRVLDATASGELSMKVDAFDEEELLKGMRQIANRVTTGLVLAALVVAAAMLMQVETESTLFGYPAIAIVCFLLAFGGAVALLIGIIREGSRHRR
jgi:ubiquinone biosynthesis protein